MFDLTIETTNNLCKHVADIVVEYNKMIVKMNHDINALCEQTKYEYLILSVNRFYENYNESHLQDFIRFIENREEFGATFLSITRRMKAGEAAEKYAVGMDARVLEATQSLNTIEFMLPPTDGYFQIHPNIYTDLQSIVSHHRQLFEDVITGKEFNDDNNMVVHAIKSIPMLLLKLAQGFCDELSKSFKDQYDEVVRMLIEANKVLDGERADGFDLNSLYITHDTDGKPQYIAESSPISIQSASTPSEYKAQESPKSKHKKHRSTQERKVERTLRKLEKATDKIVDEQVKEVEQSIMDASDDEVKHQFEEDVVDISNILENSKANIPNNDESVDEAESEEMKALYIAICRVREIKVETDKVVKERETEILEGGKKYLQAATTVASVAVGIATGGGLIAVIIPTASKILKTMRVKETFKIFKSFRKAKKAEKKLNRRKVKEQNKDKKNGFLQKGYKNIMKLADAVDEQIKNATSAISKKVLSSEYVKKRVSEDCIEDMKKILTGPDSDLMPIVNSCFKYHNYKRSGDPKDREIFSLKKLRGLIYKNKGRDEKLSDDLHICANVMRYCKIKGIKCKDRIVLEKTLELCGYDSQNIRKWVSRCIK